MARKNDILSIYTKEVEQIKADGLFKGEAKLMMKKDMGLLLSDLSAEHRTSTKNWKRRFPDFWEQMIRFYILPALMQMVDFLKQS